MSLRSESLTQTTNCTGYQRVRSIRQFLISQNKPCSPQPPPPPNPPPPSPKRKLHVKHFFQFYPWMAVIPRRNKKTMVMQLILRGKNTMSFRQWAKVAHIHRLLQPSEILVISIRSLDFTHFQSRDSRWVIDLINHSEYFPNSDWLKAHA